LRIFRIVPNKLKLFLPKLAIQSLINLLFYLLFHFHWQKQNIFSSSCWNLILCFECTIYQIWIIWLAGMKDIREQCLLNERNTEWNGVSTFSRLGELCKILFKYHSLCHLNTKCNLRTIIFNNFSMRYFVNILKELRLKFKKSYSRTVYVLFAHHWPLLSFLNKIIESRIFGGFKWCFKEIFILKRDYLKVESRSCLDSSNFLPAYLRQMDFDWHCGW